MISLSQVALPINFTDKDIILALAKILNIDGSNIQSHKILKLSIDARKKPNVKYIATIGACLKNGLEDKFKQFCYKERDFSIKYPKKSTDKKVIVVGFGPSGMFCALTLARMGIKPIVIEQGNTVDQREKDVENFWQNRVLNKYSNVQFGEGGAGTFSDGKLNTNLNNDYCKMVTEELYGFGAPQEITYINKPHIGSDKLKQVVKNIREHIKQLGGKFMFGTKLIDIGIENEKVNNVTLKNVHTDEKFVIDADKVLLCIGHSARDTFEMLYTKKVEMKQKPFAMGVRIEHKQKDINLSQYGKENIKGLSNADYKLAVHLGNGRSVFTFCMCPGGVVVASSSEDGEVVTNGMSYFARDGENANSALLVNVLPSDFGGDSPLAGVYYQAKYERLAFMLGGSNYDAPAQRVGDFLGKKNENNSQKSHNGMEKNVQNTQTTDEVQNTYRPNVKLCDISKCLPDFVTESLKEGLPLLDKKLKGFAKDSNLLIAIESRTSSPLTILRNENGVSNIDGLYPVGEGAGYAGGIMSSAQDGIKAAEKVYDSL